MTKSELVTSVSAATGMPIEAALKAVNAAFDEIINAVGKGLRRLPPPVEAFSGIVAHKIVSVTSRIQVIIDRFKNGNRHSFSSFGRIKRDPRRRLLGHIQIARQFFLLFQGVNMILPRKHLR